jgi:hypothetical protein
MNIKKHIIAAITAGLLVSTTALFAEEGATKDNTVPATAKLSKDEAAKIALKKVPGGKIKEADLEMENGVLIWTFDIGLPDSKYIVETQVNAVTGVIVDIAIEAPADQAREKAEDAKAEKKEKGEEDEKEEKK